MIDRLIQTYLPVERGLEEIVGHAIVQDVIDGEEVITVEPSYQPKNNPCSVYFMDQVLFDSKLFNQGNWINTIHYLSQVQPDAVWLSAAITRIDRPEYKLPELVSFWMTKEKVRDQLKTGPSLNDPLQNLMGREFEIAEKRFSELRQALPNAKLYYHWSTDDGFSTNRIIHYLALKHRRELKGRLKHIEARADFFQSRIRKKYREKRDFREEMRDLAEETEYEKINSLKQEIRDCESELDNLNRSFRELRKEINVSEEELEYFRPRKESPVHQMIVSEGFRFMKEKYAEILQKHDIEFLIGEAEIEVNGNNIIVNENARMYDSPIVNRAKRLSEDIHTKTKELHEKDILLIVEGHQGRYDFMRIDTSPSNAELNGEYEGLWFQPLDSYPESIYVCVLPVYHDLDKAARFVRGKEPERLSGRKPVGSRSHYAIKRLGKGAISALFGFHIDEEGRVGRELTAYDAATKGITIPERWYEEEGHSDMHLFCPSTDIALVDGAKERRLRKWKENRTFLDRPIVPAMLKTVGDDIESNSAGWTGAGAEYRRESALDYSQEIGELSKPIETIEDRVEFVSRILARKLRGAWENIGNFQQMDADYYIEQLVELEKKSQLEIISTFIGSNHAFLSLRGSGINPHEILMYVVQKGLVGENLADRVVFDERDARSNAVTFYLRAEDLGPLRNTIVHDPKWQKTPGRTALAYGPMDSALVDCGHYHLSGEAAEPWQGNGNRFRFGSMHPCFTRVSSTDVKKSGRIRNRGTKTTLFPALNKDSFDQIIVFENEPRLLWYESRRAMRLKVKRELYASSHK